MVEDVDQERLAKEILWMIRVRWVIVTFPYLIFLRIGQAEPIQLGFFYGLIPWIEYLLNTIYYFLVKQKKWLLFVAYFQMVVDLAAITIGVHLAGGLASWFGVLIYPVIIVTAAIILSTKASFLMATLSSLFYSGLVGLEYFEVIPRIPFFGLEVSLYENPPYVIVSLVVRIVFFYWIALISGHLADGIKKGREELRKTCDELRETQNQLIQSEKLAVIGQMAAGIAHELRNPLNVINSAAYYLKSKIGRRDPELNLSLEHIEREIARADKVIVGLLGFSRPVDSIGSIEINTLLDDTLLLLGKEFSLSNIEVVKEYAQNLPEVVGDRGQLQEVFLNIVLNAYQAMPKGGILRIKSRESKGEKEGFIEIVFEDTGQGIPQNDLPRLFEPFFTTRAEGTGLGLAVSYQIIKRHNGEILAESTLGKGSSFIVRLPMKIPLMSR
ncbi:TPA: hypothetical protein DCX15_01960 [bacterium]|nr:hypothetical protein [bacterium]